MNHFDRRTLLRAAVGGVFASRAFAAAVPIGPMARAAALGEGRSAPTEKVLFIFLRGGMDGVSAVVPFGDSTYVQHRTVAGTTLVDPNTAIPLTGVGGNNYARLHPRMQALVMANSPWAQGELAFIHQVGNPAGGRSHFSEMTRLESGETASASVLDPEGWVPRLLSSAAVSSPLGGATVSPLVQRLFQSSSNPMLHVRDVERFQQNAFNPQLQRHLSQTPPATSPVEVRVDTIGDRMLAAQSALAAALPFAHDPTHFPWVPNDPWPLVTPPTGPLRGFLHDLEGALYLLRETDCCIAGVELGAFDTHDAQVAELTPLLEVLAFGMWSVWDVTQGQISLTTLAMSEFGRTAAANGNAGTDHGLGGLMIASGPRVIGGVYNCDQTATPFGAAWSPLGTQVALPPAALDWNAIPVATHFLVVFREMVEKLFGITTPATLAQILPGLATPGVGPNLGFLI